MKYSALLAATLMTAAMTSPAIAQSKIPANLHQYPEKFCFVAGVVSAGIMARTNAGYDREYLYHDVNQMEQPQLRAFLNETVTLASQFAQHSSGPVDVKMFAEWNHERCLAAMKPVRIHADGSKTYLDN